MTGQVTAVSASDELPGLIADGRGPISRPELFWRARYLRASGALGHLPLLFWLVTELRPGRAVTLNMQQGVLHFALCQAVETGSLPTACRGFGDWEGTVPDELAAYNAEHHAGISRLAAAGVEAAAARFQPGRVDLVVVEGPLDAPGVDALAEHWLGRLSSRGVLLLSDLEEYDAAAADRLEALADAHPGIRFEHGSGLAVLLAGDRLPERLSWLVGLGEETRLAVGRILARLGSLHLADWQAAEARALVAGAEARARQAEAEGARRHALELENERLEARLAELTAQATRLEARAEAAADARHRAELRTQTELLATQEEDRIALRTALAETEERLARSEAGTAAATARLDAQARELAALHEARSTADDRLVQREAELGDVRARQHDLERELGAARDALAAAEERIARQDAEIAGAQARQDDLGRDCAARREAQAATEERLAGREAELRAAAARRKDLERQLKALRAQRNRIARERDALARRVGDLMASTSWRITGPLRQISTRIGRSG